MSYHEYDDDGRIRRRHYNGRRVPKGDIYFTTTISAELTQAKRRLIALMGENAYIRWAYKLDQSIRDSDNRFLAEINFKIDELDPGECTCEPGQETPCPACRRRAKEVKNDD
jgi:hypothetical protein